MVLGIDEDTEVVTAVAMKITSTGPRDKFDFVLEDWADIPLDHISTICPAKVAKLPYDSFKYKAGEISARDWDEATDRFAQAMNEQEIE